MRADHGRRQVFLRILWTGILGPIVLCASGGCAASKRHPTGFHPTERPPASVDFPTVESLRAFEGEQVLLFLDSSFRIYGTLREVLEEQGAVTVQVRGGLPMRALETIEISRIRPIEAGCDRTEATMILLGICVAAAMLLATYPPVLRGGS